MSSTIHPEPAASPLQAVMDQARVALCDMVKLVDDGALADLGAAGLVGFLQEWESLRNTMPVVDQAAIQYGTEQGIAEVLTLRSMTQVLTTALRLSSAEAHRRVKAAAHLAERHSMVGEPLGPIRPHLAAAQRDGAVTPEHVAIIDGALRKVDRCEPAEVAKGEEILVEAAAHLGPQDLKTLAEKVVEAIDPDGSLPDEAAQRRRRFWRMVERRDGTWAGEFRLTAELGRKLKDLLDPLTKPTTTSHDRNQDGGKPGKFVEEDDRTLGQRRHDALETIVDRLLRRDDNPDAGGTPATLLITIDWDDFLAKAGIGHYSDGTPVSVKTALGLAEQAEIAWCFTDAKGSVLDQYRSRRIATKDQTLALYARDSGCSFPGCQVEPQWCERHHVISWWLGGLTNLGNLTLLCPYHHRHFERRGWQCRMMDGLPFWIPPKWIDREQTPILNDRITVANWHRQDPLDL